MINQVNGRALAWLVAVLLAAPATANAQGAAAAGANGAESILFASTGTAARAAEPGTAPHLSVGATLADARGDLAVLDALAYDAANVGGPDLRLGPDAIVAAAGRSKTPVVSANVYRAGGRERLAKPSAVVQAFGRRVGVTGFTAPPAAKPAGLDVGDPVESLRDVIPALQKQSDLVVVLAWADPDTAAAVLKQFPGVALCIAGGPAPVDPLALHVGDGWVAQVPRGGDEPGTLARYALKLGGPGQVASLSGAFVPAPPAPASVARARAASEPVIRAADAGTQPAAPPAPAAAVAAGDLTPDKPAGLNAVAANRAARLTVYSVTSRSGYGALQAAPGRRLLVLNAEWENLIPLTLVYQKQVPTEYQVPNVGDNLYLLVNGSRVARLRTDAGDLPGHLPVKDFKLPRIGSKLRGNIVFDVPAEGLRTAELRFYDYAHGHMKIPLVGTAGDVAGAEKPLAPPLKNEVVEAAAYGVQKADAVG